MRGGLCYSHWMHQSLLPRSRQRLAAILAAKEESAAFAHTETPDSRMTPRGESSADPLWLGLIGVADPARRAAWCRTTLDTALYAGVPRLLADLEPPTGVGLILLAASRDALPADCLEEVLRLEVRWRTHEDASADLAFAARMLGTDHLHTMATSDALRDCICLREWCLAAAGVAVILELGKGMPGGLSALEEACSSAPAGLTMFFESRAFRGPRRAAARRGGPHLVPPPQIGGIPTPGFIKGAADELLRGRGFRSFAAEVLHAMARSAVRRASLEETRLDDLIEMARTLATIGDADGPNEVEWIVPTLNRLQERARDGGLSPTEDLND